MVKNCQAREKLVIGCLRYSRFRECGHFVQDLDGGFDDRHRQGRAGALAQAHGKIQDGFMPDIFPHEVMAHLD